MPTHAPTTITRRKRIVVRLARLMTLCAQHRVALPSLPRLGLLLGCSQRTVRRDLEALEEAGIAVPAWRLNEKEEAA